MRPGSHGSTYGGNPLATAVGAAVWEEISSPEFLENVSRVSGVLTQALSSLVDRYPDLVVGLRGKGLLRGVELKIDPLPIRRNALDKGLLVGTAGSNVVRLAPPLIIDEKDIMEAVSILDACLAEAQADTSA
jgi:acetylornithine/N-succinyldiaminopimelate aminotransferase